MSRAAVAEGELGAPAVIDAALVGRIFREESGRSVAALVRVLGDIDLARTRSRTRSRSRCAAGPAMASAQPRRGGSRRRRASGDRPPAARIAWPRAAAELALLAPGDDDEVGTTEGERPVDDDRLRLIFTCCHPALSGEAQVALTLRLFGWSFDRGGRTRLPRR
jgi:RNA polymerase sigma-70 factor (ECF subfamily)